MIRMKVRPDSPAPDTSDYILDDSKTIALLLLIMLSFLGQVANVIERSAERFRFIPRFTLPLLCAMSVILALLALVYTESALTGRPPPPPFPTSLDFSFMELYANETMASVIVLIAGTIVFYAYPRS